MLVFPTGSANLTWFCKSGWYVAHAGLVPSLICRIVGYSFAASHECLGHRQNVARLSLCYRYYFGRCSFELDQLVPLPFSWGRSTHSSDRLYDFSVTIRGCYKDVYVNSFFPCTVRLSAFRVLSSDLWSTCFKCRINRHLLTVGSFWKDSLYALIFLCFFFL